MERTGPSPRRPPVKRTTTERSPHPSTQQQSQHQFLASAAGKRPDNRISPSTARQQQLSNNAPSGQHQNAEDSRARTGKQKKFLSALSRNSATAAGIQAKMPSPASSSAPVTASTSLDAMLMPPPVPRGNPSSSVHSSNNNSTTSDPTFSAMIDDSAFDELGDSLFDYSQGGGIELDGMNILDLPPQEMQGQFADFQPAPHNPNNYFVPDGQQMNPASFLGPPAVPIPVAPSKPAKRSSKSKSKSKPKAKKANLMEDDGVSPNWDERLKKSLKPRAERKPPVGGKWSEEEDARLKQIVESHGAKNWKGIAEMLGTLRNDVQCLHRWNKVLKPGLHKGPWSEEEDNIVKYMVMEHGVGVIKWSVIASQLQGRIGKQCRERWFNHLDPTIKKGEWSQIEDNVVFEAQLVFGNRWSEIAKLLPGRTENAVKNRFNSSAHKKWLSLQTPEKQLIKATGIVKEPDPNEIKRVYRLAEPLFAEAAKERERIGEEWKKKPMKRPPPLAPRIPQNATVNKINKKNAQNSVPVVAHPVMMVQQQYQQLQPQPPVQQQQEAGSMVLPNPIPNPLATVPVGEPAQREVSDETLARELMGSVSRIPQDSVVSVNDAVLQIQGNDSNSSSPSSMTGMPEHLRPPGLKIVKTEPTSSGMTPYQETPVSQAMRLVGVRTVPSSASSKSTSGSGLTPHSINQDSPEKPNVVAQQPPQSQVEGGEEGGAGVPLDLGVKIFHHLNPAAQRDIMKQLIEKKLVEQYDNMRIGGPGAAGDEDSQSGSEKKKSNSPLQRSSSNTSEPMLFNAADFAMGNLLEGGDLNELIDGTFRTGLTPKNFSAANTPSGGMDTDHALQVAVSAAAAEISRGGTEGDEDGDLLMDDYTQNLLLGGDQDF
ncbi:hypothetical protein TrST_g12494 [Triparma strigata]|uniref:Uncharacterized protein n=1 Tax=Triparma strigata TaxID=1606541 RepID=A0A9W7ELT0_9STRA|nr:hypothetical protein TrST_g12494 [Triparma strigata]